MITVMNRDRDRDTTVNCRVKEVCLL
jgi:hypothetical protein